MHTFLIVLCSIFILLIIINQKLNIFSVIYNFILSLRNDNKEKISWFDILTFIAIPIVLSIIFVLEFDFQVDKNISQTLLTVFSLIAAMLLSFFAILVSQNDVENNKDRIKVIKETASAIGTAVILSLINSVLLLFVSVDKYLINQTITSIIILGFMFMVFIEIIYVIKRVFDIIYSKNK